MPNSSKQPLIWEKFNLTAKVAVVTGGAGLLGAEFCHTLAEAGASVVIADLNISSAQDLGEELINHGSAALAVETDVGDLTSVQKMVETALDTFGRLDILINSAALDPKFDPEHIFTTTERSPNAELQTTFENYPLEAWNTALRVNLTGAFLCCQAASIPMLDQGSGVIVNISSIYGLNGPDQRIYRRPDQPNQFKPAYYSVTKAGILGLTRYLSAYYAGKNIRVNALTPGGVHNDHDETFVEAYSARTILGRMANKDELNGALLYLVSDASSYMTGANLVVDGGWTTW